MKPVRSVAVAAVLSLSFLSASLAASAQTNIEPKSAGQPSTTPANYSKEQMLTATVHQAWELSGKNEANFFEIVEQLQRSLQPTVASRFQTAKPPDAGSATTSSAAPKPTPTSSCSRSSTRPSA